MKPRVFSLVNEINVSRAAVCRFGFWLVGLVRARAAGWARTSSRLVASNSFRAVVAAAAAWRAVGGSHGHSYNYPPSGCRRRRRKTAEQQEFLSFLLDIFIRKTAIDGYEGLISC